VLLVQCNTPGPHHDRARKTSPGIVLKQPAGRRLAGAGYACPWEALDREDVHIRAKAAQSGDPQWHGRDEIVENPRVPDLIKWLGIAVTAALGQWQRLRSRLRNGGFSGARPASDCRRLPAASNACCCGRHSPTQRSAPADPVRRAHASASRIRKVPNCAPAHASTGHAPDDPAKPSREALRRRWRRRPICGASLPAPPRVLGPRLPLPKSHARGAPSRHAR
jgi:hypothetical protein